MNRPLRVLFLATYFPKPDNPLIGTWALAQAQALARRDDIDLRVLSCNSYFPRWAGRLGAGVRAYAHCPPAYDWDGLRVEYPHWMVYPAGPLNRWFYEHPELQLRVGWKSAQRALERAVKEHRPDVIFAHHTAANGYLAYQLKRRFGIPYVTTDHMTSDIADCHKLPARRRTCARVIREAASSIAVSHHMEKNIQWVFPNARSQTVFNGADEPAPAMWNAPRPPAIEGKTVVLSAGVFYPSKGFPALVRAWGRIAARFPDAVLRIVGEGADRGAIEAAIAEQKLGERVQLVGALPNRALMQEMVWADVFAIISRRDPFPTVILEALAAAKPLVWPDDSGINEVLQDGVQGLKVPPHDEAATARALERLLADADLRARLGAASKTLSQQRLTWDANAATMRQILGQACGAAA